jgi:hypothetical protein
VVGVSTGKTQRVLLGQWRLRQKRKMLVSSGMPIYHTTVTVPMGLKLLRLYWKVHTGQQITDSIYRVINKHLKISPIKILYQQLKTLIIKKFKSIRRKARDSFEL